MERNLRKTEYSYQPFHISTTLQLKILIQFFKLYFNVRNDRNARNVCNFHDMNVLLCD